MVDSSEPILGAASHQLIAIGTVRILDEKRNCSQCHVMTNIAKCGEIKKKTSCDDLVEDLIRISDVTHFSNGDNNLQK